MTEKYTIKDLIETFGKHHEKVVQDRKELMDKVALGEIEHATWMDENFSICLALQTICKEIKKLNNHLSILED